MSEEKITVYLVDDHQFIIDGVTRMLETEEDIEVIGSSLNGQDCLDWMEQSERRPQLLITDLEMPKMKGTELVKLMKERYPEVCLLVLTMHEKPQLVREIAEAEADGFLLKSSDQQQFIKAVKHIADGGSYFSNEVIKHLYGAIKAQQKTEAELAVLSTREVEIVKLVMLEKSSQQIADELFISKRTVDTHRKNILQKTGCKTLIGLFKYAYRNGLVT